MNSFLYIHSWEPSAQLTDHFTQPIKKQIICTLLITSSCTGAPGQWIQSSLQLWMGEDNQPTADQQSPSLLLESTQESFTQLNYARNPATGGKFLMKLEKERFGLSGLLKSDVFLLFKQQNSTKLLKHKITNSRPLCHCLSSQLYKALIKNLQETSIQPAACPRKGHTEELASQTVFIVITP